MSPTETHKVLVSFICLKSIRSSLLSCFSTFISSSSSPCIYTHTLSPPICPLSPPPLLLHSAPKRLLTMSMDRSIKSCIHVPVWRCIWIVPEHVRLFNALQYMWVYVCVHSLGGNMCGARQRKWAAQTRPQGQTTRLTTRPDHKQRGMPALGFVCLIQYMWHFQPPWTNYSSGEVNSTMAWCNQGTCNHVVLPFQ